MVSVNLGLVHYLGTPFFSKGWGGTKLDLLERMVKQLFPESHCQNWPPTAVHPMWKTVWETNNSCLREGVFRTTCDERLIDALPPESHNARVAFLTPKNVTPEKMSCVVHLAGTGDHTFERRLRLGGPLLKDNIATMVLESMQRGAKLQCVSDLLLLGKTTIDEARSLLYWLETEAGYGKMGICGLSMGMWRPCCNGGVPASYANCHTAISRSTLRREDAAQKTGITIEQVRERLRSVLSLTDVTRFPVPKNPQAVIFVGATVSVSLLSFSMAF
ncbi:hypothetical protein HU200_006211 [Digitaria exilis]|uniref:Uncharacterized protein n=1 Tax=Digitaria exilis TaxID=1010633 RepID=A0A835FPI9_9POAL|nr:hypothetical protein HU200_006211 [Digitaria exilis]